MSAVAAVRQWSWRSRLLTPRAIPMLGIAAVPALIGGLGAWFGMEDPFADYGNFIAPLCLYFVLPLACMFAILPTLADLYESSAIGHFFVRPVPRWHILLGAWQGAVLALFPAMALATLLPAVLMALGGGSMETNLLVWLQRATGLLAVLTLGTLSWGAVCIFLATATKRPILWAVGLLIGWGAVVGAFPGDLRVTSPHRYLFGLARSWCDIDNTWTGFFVPDPEPPTAALSLVVLACITIVFLLLAARAVNRRDVL